MAIELLVFGPHPDDIEIGLGGAIARHTAAGHRVGLCDLTEGELSSNGTVEERRLEAAAAARVLGAAWRESLAWPDGGIAETPAMIRSAVDLIRRHRPRTIAIPYWDDRHPDHVAASRVLRVAAFKSGLRRYLTGTATARSSTATCIPIAGARTTRIPTSPSGSSAAARGRPTASASCTA